MFEDNLPSKSEIFDLWKEKIFELGLFLDWGEPSCWVCGFHYEAKYDIGKSDAAWNEILARWNKIPLQRCHIIPRSLGGPDSPDNLFLMCKECHDLAPNTNIPDIFFEWAKSQSWELRNRNRLIEAFRSFQIEESSYEEFLSTISSESFNNWAKDKVGLHWPQSGYASKLLRLTPTSIVGLVKHYLRDKN
jgi:5-methylcytosine-specific restriction endonuclease McrA